MASKSNGVEHTAWARAPPKGTAWERIGRAIYDHEEKSFLGRTPKRWGIAFAFYLVFYAVLAVMFAICMTGLYHTLDPVRPTYTLDKSLIGSNPGVASRPRPVSNDLVVRYNVENSSHYDVFVSQLDEYLEPYINVSWYPVKDECTMQENYGFPNTPCFFIKLNKIIDWKPQFYDDVDSLPASMPDDLREYITSLDALERQQVWISCAAEGTTATRVQYPWGRGLPGRFYPYSNNEGYISPLLPVRIIAPANTLVAVRCQVWAKNIVYNKSMKEPSGYTRLLVYIGNDTAVDTAE